MKYRGIVYDVGLRFIAGGPYSVENFDPNLVAYDIKTISKKMYSNAIRIEGEEIDRLIIASNVAKKEGLTIFFNPWKMNVPISDLSSYFKDAAIEAEKLRQDGADIVFVCGCEITLFNEGFFEGNNIIERVQSLAKLASEGWNQEDIQKTLFQKSVLLNSTLQDILKEVRRFFKGKVTYSAGMWEMVDWSSFDIVGIDHYRTNESADEYVDVLNRYPQDKPLIVMEVGSCAYEGAAILGSGGFMRLQGINPDGTGIFQDGVVPIRSEIEQSNYVEEQIQLLNQTGAEGVFVFVFSFPTYRYGEGLRDLDMMSFSLVKTYPDDHPKSKNMPPWEPKKAFNTIANLFKIMEKS